MPASIATLDLRHLAPPEPMERILAAVETLATGDCLDALTPLYPAPLLSILHADGLETDVDPVDGGFRVRITRVEQSRGCSGA